MTAVYSVGIDVALRSHRVAVLGGDGEAVGKSFTIESTAGGFAALVETLHARGAGAAQSVIGLEATGHLWENLEAHLTRVGYRVVVLNPVQTRRYRDVLRRKAKTDDIDAYVIAGLLRSGAAAASYVPAETIQSLRELARLRARLMRDRQNYLRQLGAQLSVVFPEHATALGDLLTARARGILRACPTAYHLAAATPRTIHHAAHSAGARGFTREDATRVRDLGRASIYSGKAATARGNVVRTLVTHLERLTAAIEELDTAMAEELPPPTAGGPPSDAELLHTLPGVGTHTVATLLGELGTLSRFTSSKALVAYVGFYPQLAQSGERAAAPHLVRLGSRLVRRTAYLMAVNAIRGSAEFRTLYLRKKAQGKKPKQALIVVAVKLLHTMYAMVRDRHAYTAGRVLVAPPAGA